MREHDSTLVDKIIELRRTNQIPKLFRVAHIAPFLAREYSDNYVRTALANFCEGTGNFVKAAGAIARFRRVEKGLYELCSN